MSDDDFELGGEASVPFYMDQHGKPNFISTPVSLRKASHSSFRMARPETPYDSANFDSAPVLPQDFVPTKVSSTQDTPLPGDFNPYDVWNLDRK